MYILDCKEVKKTSHLKRTKRVQNYLYCSCEYIIIQYTYKIKYFILYSHHFKLGFTLVFPSVEPHKI